MSNVLVFIEQRDGKIRKASFEALTLGREVAAKTGGALGAVVAGSGIAGLAPELAAYGAAKVFVADKPELALYSCEGYTAALDAAVTAFAPGILLVPATSMGKDVAPRLAARRKVGLLSDVMSLDVEGGRLVATRLVYSGKARATVANTLRLLDLHPDVQAAIADGRSRLTVGHVDLWARPPAGRRTRP